MPTPLQQTDPEVFSAIQSEIRRQSSEIELIASENFVSEAVLEAQGSVLTNKYAEGLPGKRYYGGCEFVDVAENLARDRAKKLFGADMANVQPHSGASANIAAYFALGMKPGDTLLGMNLSDGGHLTHGSPVNFSGKLFNVVSYGVNPETGFVDMEDVAAKAREHKPQMILAGFSAYPRKLDFARFREIADEVGGKLLVDMAHVAGLVATGHYPDPVPHAHIVTTTTHKTLRGPRGGMILATEEMEKAVNKSVFPGFQGGPLMHTIAAKAVAFGEAMRPEFKDYSAAIIENAKVLGETLAEAGLDIVSGGTDNHLLLVDLTKTGITGKEAEEALAKASITVNKNTIPGETRSPFVTSGIRIGSPACTTRGMGVAEFKTIGTCIAEVIENPESQEVIQRVRERVLQLTDAFPIYADRLVA